MIINGLEFRQTCGACPEQYDVYRGDVQVGYVRLRHGYLRVDVPKCGGQTVYGESVNGDGCFYSHEERMHYLGLISKILSEQDEGDLLLRQCLDVFSDDETYAELSSRIRDYLAT